MPQNVQSVTVGLLALLYIPPPPSKSAEFPLNEQLVTVGLLPLMLYIPPPPRKAEFPLNVQSVTVGLPMKLNIPPPSSSAVFPSNVQLVTPRIIAYRRVSKENGTGLGLAVQAKAIREEAKRLGLPVYETYTDDGVSGGAKIEKRVELLAAIRALRKGDVLVVAKRDRIARGDVLLMAWIEKEVLKRGARIVSAAGEGTDDDDPSSVLMRRIVDAFAEYERAIIRARTKAALIVKKASGKRWCKEAPYGFKWVDGEPVMAAKEQRTIQLVKKLRADGVSFRGVVAELKKQRRSNRFGRPLNLAHVQRILKAN